MSISKYSPYFKIMKYKNILTGKNLMLSIILHLKCSKTKQRPAGKKKIDFLQHY